MANKIKTVDTPDLKQALTPELLGAVIKARRTQSNLRLEDAAALSGVAKQTLMCMEQGKSSAQLDSILKVCTGLGIKLFIAPFGDAFDDWA